MYGVTTRKQFWQKQLTISRYNAVLISRKVRRMEFEKNLNGSELTIKPVGRLDTKTAPELEKFIKENFADEIKLLVLDFAGVDFISSRCLRILISTYKELNGRQMEIINANQPVKEVFNMSGLIGILNIKE